MVKPSLPLPMHSRSLPAPASTPVTAKVPTTTRQSSPAVSVMPSLAVKVASTTAHVQPETPAATNVSELTISTSQAEQYAAHQAMPSDSPFRPSAAAHAGGGDGGGGDGGGVGGSLGGGVEGGGLGGSEGGGLGGSEGGGEGGSEGGGDGGKWKQLPHSVGYS